MLQKNARIFATISEKAGRQSLDTNNPANVYNNMLYLCRGKEVEVETDYLFLNQLNTAPIDGVNENGLRLFFSEVKSIRLENCTFDDVKREVTERYKRDWNMELQDKQFSAWRSGLGISKDMKPTTVYNEHGELSKVWEAA